MVTNIETLNVLSNNTQNNLWKSVSNQESTTKLIVFFEKLTERHHVAVHKLFFYKKDI